MSAVPGVLKSLKAFVVSGTAASGTSPAVPAMRHRSAPRKYCPDYPGCNNPSFPQTDGCPPPASPSHSCCSRCQILMTLTAVCSRWRPWERHRTGLPPVHPVVQALRYCGSSRFAVQQLSLPCNGVQGVFDPPEGGRPAVALLTA